MANPPITLAMLGVLDHDDNIESLEASRGIGLDSLTPLSEMLSLVFQVIAEPSTKKEG